MWPKIPQWTWNLSEGEERAGFRTEVTRLWYSSIAISAEGHSAKWMSVFIREDVLSSEEWHRPMTICGSSGNVGPPFLDFTQVSLFFFCSHILSAHGFDYRSLLHSINTRYYFQFPLFFWLKDFFKTTFTEIYYHLIDSTFNCRYNPILASVL